MKIKNLKLYVLVENQNQGLIYKAKKEFNIELKKSFLLVIILLITKLLFNAGVKSILLNKDLLKRVIVYIKKIFCLLQTIF